MQNIRLMAALMILMVSCKSTGNSKSVPANTEPAITGTYWKLFELQGKPVTNPPANQKEAYFQLIKDGSKIQGNGSCNGFGGTWESAAPMQIRFSNLVGTMMACPEMSVETGLMKALENADNYTIKDKVLSLNKARMAPLARFEAVAGK